MGETKVIKYDKGLALLGTLLGVFLLMLFIALLPAQLVSANEDECDPNEENCCGNIETSFNYRCPSSANEESGDVQLNPIYFVLLFAVNLMAAGIGFAVVGAIIWGSIKYAQSNGNPEHVKEGIKWILNAITGLLLFLAMYAIINFLVPGGLFNEPNAIQGVGTREYENVEQA